MFNERLTKRGDDNILHVFDINDHEIESGEIVYVGAIETEQKISDLLTEFDEMGFAPTTLHPDPEQYAIDWRDQVRKEFARLIAENQLLKEEVAEQKSIAEHEHATQMEWFSIAGDYKAENAELKKRLENALAELKGGRV